MSEYLLEMKGVCKEFPGVKALDNVSLRLRPGTVHALMGENGAGKSTLMKCLFGVYKMDAGEVIYKGEPVHIANPFDALQKGIAMVHQELQPIPERSIAENIYCGRYPRKMGGIIRIPRRCWMAWAWILIPRPSWAPFPYPRCSWWRSPRPSLPTPVSSSWTSLPPP